MLSYLWFTCHLSVAVVAGVVSLFRLTLSKLCILVMLVFAMFVLPWNGLSLSEVVRGFTSDWSVGGFFILCYVIARQCGWVRNNESQVSYHLLSTFIVAAWTMIILYVYPIGFFQPYAWGYSALLGVVTMSVIGIYCVVKRDVWWTVTLMAILLAYGLSWLPSDNWWDYCIDPFTLIGISLYRLRDLYGCFSKRLACFKK